MKRPLSILLAAVLVVGLAAPAGARSAKRDAATQEAIAAYVNEVHGSTIGHTVYPANFPVYRSCSVSANAALIDRYGVDNATMQILGVYLLAWCGKGRTWQTARALYGPEVRPIFDALVATWGQYRP